MTAGGTLEIDFDVTGWSFYSQVDTCTVMADCINGGLLPLTLPAGFQSNVNLPEGMEEPSPTFTIVVNGAATFYYTVVGKETLEFPGVTN